MGIIRSFKINYRKLLLRKFVSSIDESSHATVQLKVKNHLEALHFVTGSWDLVTKRTITNCFKAAGFPDQEETENVIDADELNVVNAEEEQQWYEIAPEIDFSDYIASDEQLATCDEEPTEIETIEEPESDKSDDEASLSDKPCSFADAVNSIETIKKYLMRHTVDESVFSFLHKIEREIYSVKN